MASNPIHEADLEMSAVASTSAEQEDASDVAIKKAYGQMEVPLRKKEHTFMGVRFDPTFYKCDGKIVKYDSSGLSIWKALISFSHTILSDGDTWSHLSGLTVICFITMTVCIATGNYRSIDDGDSVTARIQVLISFVFAGYVNIVITRWDRIRNTTLGVTWGALENLNLLACQLLAREDSAQDAHLCDLLLRQSRLCLQLLFKAVQGDGDLSSLTAAGLLTAFEAKHLQGAAVGTRPLVLVSWMNQYFLDLKARYGYPLNELVLNAVMTNIANLRGGIGATAGAIGTQLPYPYVHVVYWTIQILLAALSIETGVRLATDVYTKKNGNGAYSPADDTVLWPQNEDVWYANTFLQITASNIVFALFCEGLLKICDKLSNPMSKDDTSFSERVFDAFLFNNCRAMRAGVQSAALISESNAFKG